MSKIFKTLAGVAVSGLFVWMSLRGKDIAAIDRSLLAADYRYLAAYLVILSLIHLCRTLRWGLLLRPLDPDLSFRRLNSASAVGLMLLVVMPFRLGELARPLLVRDGRKLRTSNVMPSIIVERIVDGLFMAALLLGTLPFVSSEASHLVWLRRGALLCATVFGGAGALMVMAAVAHDLTLRLVNRSLRLVSDTLAEKVTGLVESFLVGLKSLPSWWSLVGYLLLTLTYWTLNGLGMGVLAQAFGISLSPLGMFTCLAVLVIGLMIPAGPGMVGTFQFFTEAGLRLFIAPEVLNGAGTAYANVLWAAQFGQQVAFGMIFALGSGFSLQTSVDGLIESDESDAGVAVESAT